jgi:hypothetical protein
VAAGPPAAADDDDGAQLMSGGLSGPCAKSTGFSMHASGQQAAELLDSVACYSVTSGHAIAGLGKRANQVNIIDFGLAKKYR